MTITDKKRLLFVIPSLVCGGAEKILLLLLASLDKDAYSHELVVFEKKAVERTCCEINSGVVYLGKKRPWDFFKLIFELSELIKKERPHLIVSFLTYSNYLTLIAKILSGVDCPVVIAEHSVILRGERSLVGFIKRLIVKFTYPYATRIVTVSKGCAKEIFNKINVSEAKVKIIPNGIDIKSINRLAQKNPSHRWFHEKIPIFITVGRLSKAKNHKLLLHAFSLISQNGNYRLVIIGEGEEYKTLRKLARSLGIEQSVLFLGYQKNPYSFISKSSIFVLSSSWESFSLAILEAMCLNIPVISTDCPFGPREIIEDKISGILVPPDNTEVLSEAMLELVTSDNLKQKYVENGFNLAQNFDINVMINKYIELFNNAMQG